jgi:hypothetical protein
MISVSLKHPVNSLPKFLTEGLVSRLISWTRTTPIDGPVRPKRNPEIRPLLLGREHEEVPCKQEQQGFDSLDQQQVLLLEEYV